MKVSSAAILVIFTRHCDGYQVSPDPNGNFKKAIEGSIKTNLPDKEPLRVVDDETYSPDIPLLQPQKEVKFPITSELLREEKTSERPLPSLAMSIKAKYVMPKTNFVPRKILGLDDNPSEYWFNNRIHTLGNTGLLGGLHAVLAPFATKLIDDKAYDGVDLRALMAEQLREERKEKNTDNILDLACGCGTSTRALASKFSDAELIVGVDTSPEMVSMGRFLQTFEIVLAEVQKKTKDEFKSKRYFSYDFILQLMKIIQRSRSINGTLQYARGNVERLKLPKASFDLVTIMYAFHEIPMAARYRILREARRLLKTGGTLAVVDISPDYEASPSMLAGEPYVLEYQKTIRKQMRSIQGFGDFQYKVVIPGHVCKWTLTRN